METNHTDELIQIKRCNAKPFKRIYKTFQTNKNNNVSEEVIYICFI